MILSFWEHFLTGCFIIYIYTTQTSCTKFRVGTPWKKITSATRVLLRVACLIPLKTKDEGLVLDDVLDDVPLKTNEPRGIGLDSSTWFDPQIHKCFGFK